VDVANIVRNIRPTLSHLRRHVLNSGGEEVSEGTVVVLEEFLNSGSLGFADLGLSARGHGLVRLSGGAFHTGEESIVGSNELGVTRTHI